MCSDLNSEISNFERASTLKAAEHEEQAERARDAKTAARESGRIGGPNARDVERHYDEEVERHERMARVHRRRAEHAAAGYVLHSPAEGKDPEFARTHGALFRAAQAAGRVRFSDE